jgi:hypothetical protein
VDVDTQLSHHDLQMRADQVRNLHDRFASGRTRRQRGLAAPEMRCAHK